MTWEKIFDGGDKWASTIAATGRDAWFVGGVWGIASGSKAGSTVESTRGHGVLRFIVESPSSVYALGEGELVWHHDGKKWTEEHAGPLPPRNQRRPFAEHMLYQALYKDAAPAPPAVLGLVLVLVKQPDGTWAAPPKADIKDIHEQGLAGPVVNDVRPKCQGRGWHWLGRDRAFFTCSDRRAFLFDGGKVTAKGRFPRQCGSTISWVADEAGEAYVTCGAALWKTDGETWRQLATPKEKPRELSSLAVADGCVFLAGARSVWRSCR